MGCLRAKRMGSVLLMIKCVTSDRTALTAWMSSTAVRHSSSSSLCVKKTSHVPPTHLLLFPFSHVQLRSSVILKAVKCAAGSTFNPLLPPPMHFFGHLTRERAFMMERSSIVLSLTTHCEYQAAHNTQSVQFSQLICHLLSNYQYYCK